MSRVKNNDSIQDAIEKINEAGEVSTPIEEINEMFEKEIDPKKTKVADLNEVLIKKMEALAEQVALQNLEIKRLKEGKSIDTEASYAFDANKMTLDNITDNPGLNSKFKQFFKMMKVDTVREGNKDQSIREQIAAQELIPVYINRKRDPLTGKSMMDTRPMIDPRTKEPVRYKDGRIVYEDVYSISINGNKYSYGLGPDIRKGGATGGRLVHVPLTIAHEICVREKQPITIPSTGEVITPEMLFHTDDCDNYAHNYTPPQNEIIDGQITPSGFMPTF